MEESKLNTFRSSLERRIRFITPDIWSIEVEMPFIAGTSTLDKSCTRSKTLEVVGQAKNNAYVIGGERPNARPDGVEATSGSAGERMKETR